MPPRPGTKSKLEKALPALNAALTALKPLLDLGAAGVTGISVPGVEGTVNGVVKLAEMTLDMKANKEDLAKLREHLKELVMIDPSLIVADPTIQSELKTRLSTLVSKLRPLGKQCDTLGAKGQFARFWSSKQHKEEIQGIKDSIASEIADFTVGLDFCGHWEFYGTVSIQQLVTDMLSRVKTIEKGVEVTRQHVGVMGPQGISVQLIQV
ncbi:hypothetical protein K438DRAFT_1775747 [Mycena galopus ATCC 62051]|nr:hypothetical protein K438DRAFT_1775747 [Mycena galopus ATCC 62051]